MHKPFSDEGSENPYSIHRELQETMQKNVGIIRTEVEMKTALEDIQSLRDRYNSVGIEGNMQYNPGWHMALDLEHMLTVAEAVTRAALERKESRGGHTRDDFPETSTEFAKVNVVVKLDNSEIEVSKDELPVMPDDLQMLFEEN